MDLISRDKAQDAVFSNEDIMGYMDGVEDGDINRTIRSAIRLIERVPSAFEGMTNGEVFQAIFPCDEVHINGLQEGYVHFSMKSNSDSMDCFSLKWWNAPYQKEGE